MISTLETLQTAQSGNADGTVVPVAGYERITFHVTASGFTGTVNFEGTIDGTNWFAVPCLNAAGSYVSTATAAGAFHVAHFAALYAIRARTSAVSGGNCTVKARLQ